MVVPQGLSYARLAGLPQVWGLYGAFAPCIVYAGFGSSRQLVSLISTTYPTQCDHSTCASAANLSVLATLFLTRLCG